MEGILARDNKHLFLEKNDNKGNSFIANINKLAKCLVIIKSINEHIDSLIKLSNDNIPEKAETIHEELTRTRDYVERAREFAEVSEQAVSQIQTYLNTYNSIKNELLELYNSLDEVLQEFHDELSIYDKSIFSLQLASSAHNVVLMENMLKLEEYKDNQVIVEYNEKDDVITDEELNNE